MQARDGLVRLRFEVLETLSVRPTSGHAAGSLVHTTDRSSAVSGDDHSVIDMPVLVCGVIARGCAHC